MASITIRQLEETTKRKHGMRTAGQPLDGAGGTAILKSALSRPEEEQPNPAEAIRRRFAPFVGVELEIPPRVPIRDSGIR
jgi:plasmid stability protein